MTIGTCVYIMIYVMTDLSLYITHAPATVAMESCVAFPKQNT